MGYHILFTKHKKVFLLWRNWPSSKTLIFADFCWLQQKLERLWQKTTHQKTPFDKFYQLTKFHDQSFSQTGSIEDWKNADIIKMLLFWSIFGRSRTTHPSQKTCNLYIFWKNILLAIISFLQNTKKCFCFGEIDLLAIP